MAREEYSPQDDLYKHCIRMDWLKLKESGESVFIHGDCMYYLPLMPDKFAELAIVDPPSRNSSSKRFSIVKKLK